MKSFAILFILVLTIIWVPAVNAEVYTWVDENGVRHYGDSPPEDAEDAKAVFPEYQYDESQDQQRTEQDQQELNSLIREIDSEFFIKHYFRLNKPTDQIWLIVQFS